jgi:signal peptidase I
MPNMPTDLPTPILIDSPQTDPILNEMLPSKKGYTWRRLVKDTGQTVLLALIIYLVLGVVAQPHVVDGSSMQPNYHTGEFVLTNKLPVWFKQLKRGQVVVLQSPSTDPGKQYYKRIIGLAGERIKISNNNITIYNQQHPNGFVLREPYLGANTITTGNDFIAEGQIVTIPADQYIVMGDNRQASYDSRAWGFVSRQHIVGTAYVIYWPVSDMEIIPTPQY